MVNLERTCVLLFYYFLCFKVNLDLENTNQLGESSPNFILAVVNLDPIILEKKWIDGESWPNDFVEKVNKGEDLRWVSPRCPLTHALGYDATQGANLISTQIVTSTALYKYQIIEWHVEVVANVVPRLLNSVHYDLPPDSVFNQSMRFI